MAIGNVRVYFLEDLTYLPARKFRHPKVREDKIELVGLELFNPLLSVGGHDDLMSFGDQHLTEDFLDRGIILDHQDSGWRSLPGRLGFFGLRFLREVTRRQMNGEGRTLAWVLSTRISPPWRLIIP